jgi:hypothetical protein
VDDERVVEVKRIKDRRDAIPRRRNGELVACARPFGITGYAVGRLLAGGHPLADANPPERLTDVYAKGTQVVPRERNLGFASALTRLLTARCIGLISETS